MQLLADRVLIRRVEEHRLIHCTDAPKSLKGIVLAVGPGKRDEDGERIPLGVKPGDKVLFNSRWNDFSAGENVGTGADLSGALERPLPLRRDPMLHLVREADIFGTVPHFDMKVELLPDNAHAQYSQKIEIAGPWSDPANA